MVITPPKNFFTVGIFADVKENLESFNYNIYLSYMMQESLTRRAKIETLHAAALQARDTQLIQEISKELELFDNSLALTAAMLNQLHDEN
jgi:hypothetical protein